MTLPIDAIVVTDIASDTARVQVSNAAHKEALLRNGFIEQDDGLTAPLDSTDARIRVLAKLIQLGALFSAGPGWSPAELAQYYREQGFIDGPFKVIAWTSPGHCQVTDR